MVLANPCRTSRRSRRAAATHTCHHAAQPTSGLAYASARSRPTMRSVVVTALGSNMLPQPHGQLQQQRFPASQQARGTQWNQTLRQTMKPGGHCNEL